MKHEYTDGVVNDLRNGHWPKKTKNLQENWMLMFDADIRTNNINYSLPYETETI